MSSQMPDTMARPSSSKTIPLPTGLHHAAYVCADQERTRQFYEDVLGFPLIAFWIEHEILYDSPHEFSHAFYGLADGSALAFFNFADAELQQRYTPKSQEIFVHLALKTDRRQQEALRQRLKDAGHELMEFDHGFCYSIYVRDPDGQLIEFAADAPDADALNQRQLRVAHDALKRWQAGERSSNNDARPRH